jgi:hypothetical protein
MHGGFGVSTRPTLGLSCFNLIFKRASTGAHETISEHGNHGGECMGKALKSICHGITAKAREPIAI